jgi:hypothetical protein
MLTSPATLTPPTCRQTSGALAPQGIGAFAVKINSGGAGIAYLTYLGSGNYFQGLLPAPANVVHAIAIIRRGTHGRLVNQI